MRIYLFRINEDRQDNKTFMFSHESPSPITIKRELCNRYSRLMSKILVDWELAALCLALAAWVWLRPYQDKTI